MTAPERRHPSIAWRLVEGQAVLVRPDGLQVRVLNEVGSFIWERLDGRDIDGIARDLSGAFEVDEARAREDASVFVGELRAEGLLAAP